jgi:hypothetical protein
LAYGGVPQGQRARIQHLEKAVLAPCCYTETVGQHQSEIAVQMRVEIAKWVEQGRTDEEILDTYAARYDAKVLVDPNTIPNGWTLVVPGRRWPGCARRSLDAVSLARSEAIFPTSMTSEIHPTSLDSKAIQLLTPFQAKPFCVDAADILSQNTLVNGLVFAVPLFLLLPPTQTSDHWLSG